MDKSSEVTGKAKYDLRDPPPDNLVEVERQIEHWMSQQNAGEAGSNWEHWVGNKLSQLRWKQEKLLRSAAAAQKQSLDLPLIFLSCGQCTEAEKGVGRQVKELLEQNGTLEVYFADFQCSLEALTNNILGALNRCVGFIAIMHHRGKVATPKGEKIRASVWIEQEIAIAAFIRQILGRSIEVQLYIQEGINLEGMRDKVLLNPQSFRENEEVLTHLKNNISRWTSLAAGAARPDQAFEDTFQQKLDGAKANFWLRTARRDGVDGHVRSDTHFWTYLFPTKHVPLALDANTSNDFRASICRNFSTDRKVADSQGTPIETEVTFDKAREFSLPITTHSEERRWRLTSESEIGFVAQSAWGVDDRSRSLWSAYDVALDSLSLLRLAFGFLEARGYKGPVRLVAELKVGHAKLFSSRSTFPALFHQQLNAATDHVALDPGVIIGNGAARGYASAQVDFTVASLGTQAHDIIADVLHNLVCGLGYEVDLPKMQDSLRVVFT